MHYASLTRNDRNPVKRFLQRRRIVDALDLADLNNVRAVLDFGAGDGELSRRLARSSPDLSICCYEPCALFRNEAGANTRGLTNIDLRGTIAEVPDESFDLIFCLEVFEHLDETASRQALEEMRRLLRPDGQAIIGVPIEVHLPALVKGIFRMARRYGDYDARPTNVLRATAGRPPADRPAIEIDRGLRYHTHHLGFDDRALRAAIGRERFSIVRAVGSPYPALGRMLNSELHFVVRKHAERLPGP